MPRISWQVLFWFMAIFLLFCGRVRIAPPDLAFYYALPESIINDVDLQLHNEYADFPFAMHELYVTSEGYPANDWPPGTGICWLPFLLLAKIMCAVTGIAYDHGNSWMAQWVVTYGATLLFGFGTVWLTYKWCLLEGLSKNAVCWSVALHAIGSTFTYHLYVNSADSHAPSAFFTVLLLYTWRTFQHESTWQHYVVVGIIAGMGALVRPHNALILLIPFICDVGSSHQQKKYATLIINYCVLTIAFIVMFSPQFILWKTLYGSWLAAPRAGDELWLHPQWYNTLFSHYHGLFTWSPIFMMGLIGLFLTKKGCLFSFPLLLQLYLVSCHIAWWAGGSFGNRRMVGCVPLFIFGLALLFHQMPKRWLKLLACACAAWTILLMLAEIGGAIQLSQPMSWQNIMDAIPQGVHPGLWFHVSFPQWQEHTVPRFIGCAVVSACFAGTYFLLRQINWTLPKLTVLATTATLIVVLICGVAAWNSKPLSPQQASNYIPYDRFNWEVYYESAFFHLSQNDADTATKKYLAAVTLDPRHPNTMRYLALIYRTQSCDTLSFQYSRQAFIYGYRNHDFSLFFETQLSEMLQSSAYPKHVLYNERGIIRTVMNRYFEAAADFNAALKLQPGYEKATNNLEALEEWKRGSHARLDWE
jgi:hypothetical protein